jgi:hypothetical protein
LFLLLSCLLRVPLQFVAFYAAMPATPPGAMLLREDVAILIALSRRRLLSSLMSFAAADADEAAQPMLPQLQRA